VLELRRRGDRDFLITLDGRVLMTSAAHRSEAALAELACAGLGRRRSPRVLIGGLGMGFTLRAALEVLPARARVVVAELHPVVVEWCRGPLAPLTGDALSDPRVTVEIRDVARVIEAAPAGSTHAILLDLFVGPRRPRRDDPHFGEGALARAGAALAPGGVFAVWSEQTDPAFQRRLEAAGFEVERRRPGRGGLRHAVYLAVRAPDTRGDPPRGRGRRRRSSAR
jgi:spermidine synthase